MLSCTVQIRQHLCNKMCHKLGNDADWFGTLTSSALLSASVSVYFSALKWQENLYCFSFSVITAESAMGWPSQREEEEGARGGPTGKPHPSGPAGDYCRITVHRSTHSALYPNASQVSNNENIVWLHRDLYGCSFEFADTGKSLGWERKWWRVWCKKLF